MIYIALIILFILVRLFPFLIFKKNIGVDHWYWKLYARRVEMTGKFPPDIPQYLLEEKQWYPPLFPLIFTKLPKKYFEKISSFFSSSVDIVRFILLLFVVSILTGYDSRAILYSGIFYIFSPLLNRYNLGLNPRGLGALFLDGFIVICIFSNQFKIWNWSILLAAVLVSLMYLTHKMNTQLYWFLSFVFFLYEFNYIYLLFPFLAFFFSMIISRGFIVKVLIAHWDIVTFWNRNWPWLQSHLIRESPIYGEKGYESPAKAHKKGIKGILLHLKEILAFEPSAWIVLFFLVFQYFRKVEIDLNSQFVTFWFFSILVFAVLTVYVPFLKCLGSGYYYLYNAVFPASVIVGFLSLQNDMVFYFFLLMVLTLNLRAIVLFVLNQKKNYTSNIDTDFEKLIDHIQNLKTGVVMCLPPQWYDYIAYRTEHSVLYGGHGYGFKMVESTFPVLRKKIKDIVCDYKVSYLIVREDYLTENFVSDLPTCRKTNFGHYSVYYFAGN